MTDAVTITIELLGKFYPIRCPESEVNALHEAAAFLNKKMLEVQEMGKTVGADRIAIITALNLAYELLSVEQSKSGYLNKINHRIVMLQDKVDEALRKAQQTELSYITE